MEQHPKAYAAHQNGADDGGGLRRKDVLDPVSKGESCAEVGHGTSAYHKAGGEGDFCSPQPVSHGDSEGVQAETHGQQDHTKHIGSPQVTRFPSILCEKGRRCP